MAKGKKTIIKEIKKLDDEILLINGKEYVIVEDTENIETATTMKISSNGNRILRFEDEKKKATIDVKRDIEIVKYLTKLLLDKKRRNSKFLLNGFIAMMGENPACIAGSLYHLFKPRGRVRHENLSGLGIVCDVFVFHLFVPLFPL